MIHYIQRNDLVDIGYLTPMQPTILHTIKSNWAFKGYGMCSRLPIDSSKIDNEWRNDSDPLLQLISIHPEESYLNYDKAMVLTPNLSQILVHIEEIDIFKFYDGAESNFSKTYPSTISPFFNTYNYKHCVELVFLDIVSTAAEKSCYEKYFILFREPRDKLASKWSNISKIGCRWNDNFIDCGCEWSFKHSETKSHAERACKMSSLKVIYHMMTEEVYDVNERGEMVTKLLLKPKSIETVTTTQTHAMKTIDLLSHIGGFLGLLVGASIVTLFEFIEFAAGYIIQKANKVVSLV